MTVVVSIQTGGRQETYLRGTCEDMTIASVTATVKDMLKDRKGHEIGNKYVGAVKRKPRKAAPVMRPDDERVGDGEPAELQA